MEYPRFSHATETLLLKKQRQLIRTLKRLGYAQDHIAFIFKLSKGRVSQIINEKRKDQTNEKDSEKS